MKKVLILKYPKDAPENCCFLFDTLLAEIDRIWKNGKSEKELIALPEGWSYEIIENVDELRVMEVN